MRFPQLETLDLPCIFAQHVPGRRHLDGRRYLHRIILQPQLRNAQIDPVDLRLTIIDRHERISPAHAGQAGSARIVCGMGIMHLQEPPYRAGLFASPDEPAEPLSNVPRILGQIQSLLRWDVAQGALPYTSLYTEIILAVGEARIGVRTTMTAPSLVQALGREQLQPNDWISIERVRIDILDFIPRA
jgi:hypothetical protein